MRPAAERASSPTDGKTLILEIGEHDHRGVYIPPGIAHGFYALSDMTITYLVDQYYNPADELGVAWDDPTVQVVWPTDSPELSQRDRANPRRADIPASCARSNEAEAPSLQRLAPHL